MMGFRPNARGNGQGLRPTSMMNRPQGLGGIVSRGNASPAMPQQSAAKPAAQPGFAAPKYPRPQVQSQSPAQPAASAPSMPAPMPATDWDPPVQAAPAPTQQAGPEPGEEARIAWARELEMQRGGDANMQPMVAQNAALNKQVAGLRSQYQDAQLRAMPPEQQMAAQVATVPLAERQVLLAEMMRLGRTNEPLFQALAQANGVAS